MVCVVYPTSSPTCQMFMVFVQTAQRTQEETARKPVDKLRMRLGRLAFGTPKALTFRTDSHVFGVPTCSRRWSSASWS